MFAIVEISGHQYKVSPEDTVFVDRQAVDADSKVEFEKVLLVSDDKGNVSIGKPVVEGAKIEATVVDHVRGDKIVVFKKKRRKGYKVTKGHRREFSQIRVDKISV